MKTLILLQPNILFSTQLLPPIQVGKKKQSISIKHNASDIHLLWILVLHLADFYQCFTFILQLASLKFPNFTYTIFFSSSQLLLSTYSCTPEEFLMNQRKLMIVQNWSDASTDQSGAFISNKLTTVAQLLMTCDQFASAVCQRDSCCLISYYKDQLFQMMLTCGKWGKYF